MRAVLAGLTRVAVLNLRELAGHKLRVVTSVAVVMVSAALLVAVLGTYGSMSESVRQFNAALSGDATVEVVGITDSGVDTDLAGELRRGVPGAKAVVPLVRSTVMVDGHPAVLLGSDFTVTALSSDLRTAVEGSSGASGGVLDADHLDDGVIVGAATGLHEGQRLSLSGVDVSVVRVVSDDAAGVLNGGRFVFAYLGLAQRLTGLDHAVDSLMIVPKSGVATADLERQAADVVGGRASVVDPDFRVKQVDVANSVTHDSTLLVAMVSLIIAAFLVFNTMNMAVASRRQSLAMLRALGARRRHLVGDLLAESAVLGLVGGVIGVPLGIVAGRWIIGRLPDASESIGVVVNYHLPGYAPVVAIAACMVACVGATVLAARSVFAVAPVEAMVPGEAADARPPATRLLAVSGAVGVVLIAVAWIVAETVEGRAAILAGAVYSVGGLLLCFALIPVFVGAVAGLAGRWRGPGRLAAVNTGRAPRRVWATVMTVAVAIAVGVGISGSLNNLIGSISGSLDGLAAPDFYVSSRSAESIPLGPALNDRIAEQVRALPEVSSVVGGQWASVNLGDARILVQGLEPGSSAPFIKKSSDAAVRQTLAGDGILLSTVLARLLGVGVGDTVRLATPTGYHDLVVRDTVDYVAIDSGVGAVSNQLLRDWFRRDGDTYLQVMLKPGVDQERARTDLTAIADRYPGLGNHPVHVYTGSEALDATKKSAEQAGAFTVAIQWIVAGAAAIALLNTLLLSVLERGRELSVLRAMGASRRFISRMVLSEAAAIALVGAAIGLILGSGLHVLADRILSQTTSIDIAYAPVVSAIGYVAVPVALCLIGAVVPAVRASRMNISAQLTAD
ncbi:FtsX-like permease family protein [Gordonia hydrophobica]|uniref:FtsX-like permease family protein n=1 Tax=Gordonia hydrophobica TaxID=40516 RepID=A0ABZ2TVS5_9ACTN|nr:FtsX-like permease family protein [Gordonia hydrophobica]MBM7365962.1 putative ABC transport system permease protein [Gordonia hydrophobica]